MGIQPLTTGQPDKVVFFLSKVTPQSPNASAKRKHPVLKAFLTAFLAALAAGSIIVALNMETLCGNPCAPFFGGQGGTEGTGGSSSGPPAVSTNQTFEEYINDTLFIGDSRTNGLANYGFVPRNRVYALDGANHQTARTEKFLILGSTGEKLTIAQAVGVVKPARMIVSFGINGVAFMGEDTFMEEYAAFLDELKAASPETILVVQSILPVSSAMEAEDPRLTNSIIDEYNRRLESLTLEKGGCWLDTAGLLKNAWGALDAAYDAGDGLHFNQQAYEVLLSYYDENRIY